MAPGSIGDSPAANDPNGKGSLPRVCDNHKHIIAFDTSTSNATDSDPKRIRYQKLLDALDLKENSDNEKFLFVEFSDSRIVINGGENREFQNLQEIKRIIERQADRSRDSGFTPYIDTFRSIKEVIADEADQSQGEDKYSVNFFTDGKPCSEEDGCELFKKFGVVKTDNILMEVENLKQLQARDSITELKIHTIQYGMDAYGRSEILIDIAEIGEGNSLILDNFDDQNYNEMLKKTSLSCQ